MTSKFGKQFLRENQILFSDDEIDELENEELEIEESENESETESQSSEIADISDLVFEKCEKEHKSAGRPSRLRGAHNDLPRSKSIPEEKYSNPRDLMECIYGETLYDEITAGTNEKAEKFEKIRKIEEAKELEKQGKIVDPESIPYSPFFPITKSDIIEFLGHLLLIWAFKPSSMEIVDFFVLIRAYPEAFGLKDFVIFPQKKFNFINKNLDIGVTVKVANPEGYSVIDLNKKLNPIIDHFNKKNIEVKIPDLSKPLAVDESLRGSYSKSCTVKQYMKGKPAKFGEKTYLLVDSDLFCVKLIYHFPKQFQTYNGTVDDLMDNIIPSELKNMGYTIITDNYFMTLNQLLKMQKENTAVVCTMRANRIQGRFPKSTFLELTKKSGKRNFERKVIIMESKTAPNKFLQIQFYTDKMQKKPCILATNDPFLLQSSLNDPNNKNITKTLPEKTRPPIADLYNQHMGHVDVYDQQLKKYTVGLPVGNRADKTAWLKKTCYYFFDLFVMNTYSMYRKNFLEKNPNRKSLPRNFHRKFQIELAKSLLARKETAVEISVEPEPSSEPVTKKIKRALKRAYCKLCPLTRPLRRLCSNVCSKCKIPICKNHTELVCTKCTK